MRAVVIEDHAWERVNGDHQLVERPGAAPLWSRFYEIGTDRPLFGDRDGSIHFDVREISRERRNGYAWFSDGPAGTLAKYAKWAAKHPVKP